MYLILLHTPSFMLEIRVIIKISKNPCYPINLFVWHRDPKIQNSLSNPVNSIPYIFSNHQYRKNDFFLEKTLESRAFNNLVHWLNTNSCKKITSHKKFNYYSGTFHGRLLQLLNIVPGHDFLSSIVHQNCLE